MKRVVVHRPGGHDRLVLEEQPDPVPAAGEVLVTTEAVGVNYADCIVRMGLYASARKYVGWPITPGFEFAGQVTALGRDVHGVAIGARVLGVTRFGGYSTHVVVPAHQVFPLPAGFDMRQAAAFPSVHLTAHYAIFELAHPRRGSTVLVHSAAGGVGTALLQLAKIAGCRVVGVVGASAKVEVARRFGADDVIDKSTMDLWRTAEALAPAGYDVVLDANGVATLKGSYRHLASPGKLVVYGFHSMLPRAGGRPKYGKMALDFVRTPRFSPLTLTNDNNSILCFNLSYLFEREELLLEGMRDLVGWVAEGVVAPPDVTTFPLDRVADAHRAIESGMTTGKLVLLP